MRSHAIIDVMASKEIERVDAEREKRSAITELLLANARKPLNEIAELTGIPVGAVAERMNTLFEDRGWLTERQEERLLMIELGDVLQDVKAQLKLADGRDYASVAKVVIDGMALMSNRMDSRKKLVEDDINSITRANARLFGQAFDLAIEHVANGVLRMTKDISPEMMDALVRDGLAFAKKKLDENVSI